MCIGLPASFDHQAIYRQLRLWSLNGQTKDALSKTQGAGWKYDIVYPGFKMNMPDICAAIGLAQLRKYHSFILLERKKIFDRVQQLMAEQLPVIPLVARNLIIAARQRVGNIKPGILHDSALWNSEELFLR